MTDSVRKQQADTEMVSGQPLQPGQIIGKISTTAAKFLTPLERSLLDQGGFQEGDPIPDLTDTEVGKKFAVQIAKIRGDAQNPQGLPVHPDTPPVTPPTPQPIESLPAEKQREVLDTVDQLGEVKRALELARAKERSQRQTAVPPELSHIPGMSQAYEAATVTAGPVVNVVDDLLSSKKDAPQMFDPMQQKNPTPTQHIPSVPLSPPTVKTSIAEDPADSAGPFKAGSSAPFPPASQPPSPSPSAPLQQHKENAAQPSTPFPQMPVICPRCGQDLNAPVALPADADKLAYLQCILGSQRFTKTYVLFGNRVEITFRSLLPTEADLILDQLDSEVRSGEIAVPTQYMRQFEIYRFSSAIVRIVVVGRPPIDILPIGKIAHSEDIFSALPQLNQHLNEQVFAAETLRRSAVQQWRLFDTLVRHMEAKADDPDFFSAIEGQG